MSEKCKIVPDGLYFVTTTTVGLKINERPKNKKPVSLCSKTGFNKK
jgi:hypothetical protein